MRKRVVLLAVVAMVLLFVLLPEGASAAGTISWDAGTSDGNTTRYEGTGNGDYAGYTFVRWEYATGDGSTTWTVPEGVTSVDVLVVAGGGGGGKGRGGGGGGGGVSYNTAFSLGSSPISITVGSGGAGSTSTARGGSGTNSIFGTIETTGGGGGGSADGTITGGDGGSGGGGAYQSGAGGTGIAGQGYDGGAGSATSDNSYPAGGGGGAAEAGEDGGTDLRGGDGGAGVTYFGIDVGGGGGGGTLGANPGLGTHGGGDGGADAPGEDGSMHTGGGGGGGSYESIYFPGGDGGSGIVIIRYATTSDPTPGPTSTPLNLTRPAANTTIAPISTSMYTGILDLFGNDQIITNESGAINWSGILPIVAGAYTAAMGKLALILIFAIPFVMMWIVQRDTTLPGLVGLLLGLFIIVMLPVQMMHVAIAVMAMSITAVIYSLLKERM